MADKISVSEFVKEYNACTNETARKNYLKKLDITKYLSYEQKIVIASRIVEATSRDQDGTDRVVINSPMRYVLYVFSVLSSYTNLDMGTTMSLEHFNALNQYGLIEKIFALIPEKELAEFQKIVEMTFDDFMTNYYEAHNYINSVLEKILHIVNSPQLAELAQQLDGEK